MAERASCALNFLAQLVDLAAIGLRLVSSEVTRFPFLDVVDGRKFKRARGSYHRSDSSSFHERAYSQQLEPLFCLAACVAPSIESRAKSG